MTNRINQRWEKGIPHNPQSVAIFKAIAKIDFEECDDFFGFKSGGDGDNGEHLMYLMDEWFDAQPAPLKPIHTEEEHLAAMKEVDAFMADLPAPGTPEYERLEMLGVIISAYETQSPNHRIERP